MVAGTLARSGYFMGERLMPPSVSNPKGYFESFVIEAINEGLLAPLVPRRPPWPFLRLRRDRPRRSQRWLARVAVGTPVSATRRQDRRIAAAVSRTPFCFKDPRFCYTLPAWRPHLEEAQARFLCVFRAPAVTATSILEDRERSPYLQDLEIDFERAVEVWTLMYRHVLETHVEEGDWLFLHYDQVLGGDGLERMAAFLDAPVDASFPERALERSRSDREVSLEAARTYGALCERAGFSG
jgi:hypothetical protein